MSQPMYRAPAWWRTALELRAPTELVASVVMMPLMRRLRSGDGHHVLVIPGFLGSDTTTAALRRLLRRLGYRAHGWGQGVNTGPRAQTIAELRWRLLDLADLSHHGVSVIGTSLGGVYATILAKERPAAVRQVITIASPFQMAELDRTRATALYQMMERPSERRLWRRVADLPLAVPATSLYTRMDGIVDWRACVHSGDASAQSIEVRGASHFGIASHPATLYVVADRLAQPAGDWAPFRIPRRLGSFLVCDEERAETVVGADGDRR